MTQATRVTLVLKTNEGGLWAVPQLVALRARGADVTVVLPAGPGRLRRALTAQGFPVLDSPFDFRFRPSLSLASGLLRLRRLLRSTAPDVIFYHLYASALACRIAGIALGARRVHMVAGPLYLENGIIRAVERFLCRFDSMLIAGSEYTARAYRRIGLPAGRLRTIPYGVDTERFRPGSNQRRELYGVGDSTFVVIMVAYVYAPKGTVFPGVGIKGHDLVLQAWTEFTQRHPDSLLVLVGSGFDSDGEAHRQQLLRSYDVGRSTTIRWFETVDDVRPLYASADLSVSPSLSENHGAALEASAMGLPSIVSDAGGLPEAVTDESGWVVPAGDRDALLAALLIAHSQVSDGSLAARGRAARQLMGQHFDLEKCVAQVADVVLRRAAP
ncbi:glycosyltransferase family 4 protein [Pedococcus sp. 5OH_020]|uniref:glycosyltransferase family 4 protein n=1 Tax=Pedococcus sp. 5OH_020 TaxID=2989814 RepID=UPI0022E99DA4|nr:glycosyltransferase family 4 protein [Pedococcus sp. 5OH_020]